MTVVVNDERYLFNLMVSKQGRRAPDTKKLADSLTYDGNCWSQAWKLAQELGGRYVEGYCFKGKKLVRAHSWVQLDNPLGSIVLECTDGYQDCINYRGIEVDCTPGGVIDAATSTWDQNERASVIEALIVQGFPPEEIMEIVTP